MPKGESLSTLERLQNEVNETVREYQDLATELAALSRDHNFDEAACTLGIVPREEGQ